MLLEKKEMPNFEIPSFFKNKKYLEFLDNNKYDKYQPLCIIIKHLFPELPSDIKKFDDIPISYLKKVNLKNLSYPFTYSKIKSFVKQNKHLLISINILLFSDNIISNLETISNKKGKKSVKNVLHLLMFKTNPSNKTLDPIFCKFNKNKTLKDIDQKHFFKIKNVQKLLNFYQWKISKKPSHNYQRNFFAKNVF